LFKLENVLIKKCSNFKVSEKDSKPQKTTLKTSKIRPAENKKRENRKTREKVGPEVSRTFPKPETDGTFQTIACESGFAEERKKIKWARPANKRQD
jgi:hypothetical protein